MPSYARLEYAIASRAPVPRFAFHRINGRRTERRDRKKQRERDKHRAREEEIVFRCRITRLRSVVVGWRINDATTIEKGRCRCANAVFTAHRFPIRRRVDAYESSISKISVVDFRSRVTIPPRFLLFSRIFPPCPFFSFFSFFSLLFLFFETQVALVLRHDYHTICISSSSPPVDHFP